MMTRLLSGKRCAYLLALPIAFLLLFTMTTGVFANTVHISDQANVLNTSQVQSAASNLNYPVNIYTTNTFNGTEQMFDQQADSKITRKGLIVVSIDTVHHYLRVVGGSNVPLRQYQYSYAISTFKNSFNSGAGYTSATIAALQSLQSSLSSANGNTPSNASVGFSWLPFLPICCIGLFVLGGLAIFGVARSRTRRFMRGTGTTASMQPITPVNPIDPVDPMYNQPPYGPYNQGDGNFGNNGGNDDGGDTGSDGSS